MDIAGIFVLRRSGDNGWNKKEGDKVAKCVSRCQVEMSQNPYRKAQTKDCKMIL